MLCKMQNYTSKAVLREISTLSSDTNLDVPFYNPVNVINGFKDEYMLSIGGGMSAIKYDAAAMHLVAVSENVFAVDLSSMIFTGQDVPDGNFH